jgi:hypothetical protein
MENYLENEIIRSSKQNEMSEHDFNTPLDEFVIRVHQNCYPNTYGKLFAKKLIKESEGGLVEVNQNLDLADCYFTEEDSQRKFCEVKISYINKNGKYRITNIRGYQNFDFFILSFVDMTNSFKTQCYIVPKEVICSNPKIKLTAMNGTKIINSHNKYVPMSTTLSKMDIEWLFSRHNILPNNGIKSLIKFVKSLSNKKVTITEHYNQMVKSTSSIRKPIIERAPLTRVGFTVIIPNIKNTIYICRNNNRETITDLVKALGPNNLLGAFWPSQISKIRTELINTPVGDGYYINPKFSFRDIQKMIRIINQKTNFSVHIEIVNN